MKLFLITVLAAGLFMSSCKVETGGDLHLIHLHLQSGFEQDQVRVKLDGLTIYSNDRVSSDPQTGFADAKSMLMANGEYELQVVVCNNAYFTETIDLSKELYVSINFDKGLHNLKFGMSEIEFDYE